MWAEYGCGQRGQYLDGMKFYGIDSTGHEARLF